VGAKRRPCGERADDECRAYPLREHRHEERHRERDERERRPLEVAVEQVEERRHREAPHEQCDADEPERRQRQAAHQHRRHVAARDHGTHDREDDEADHVVEHGGAQDHLALAILQPPQVGEHARRDAHRRRRERRAHHEPDEWREPERKAGEVAERERHGDTDQRDREGGRPHGEQSPLGWSRGRSGTEG
jgi:hypothetical protein